MFLQAKFEPGGYVLAEADGPRQATILSTGSEIMIAMAARESLAAEGIKVAVVSLPCWELFSAQDESYRASVLGGGRGPNRLYAFAERPKLRCRRGGRR